MIASHVTQALRAIHFKIIKEGNGGAMSERKPMNRVSKTGGKDGRDGTVKPQKGTLLPYLTGSFPPAINGVARPK